MVSTNDRGSLADRTRLVVPKIHESVWAPSNRQQSAPRQDIVAQDVVVKHPVASEVLKPVVKPAQIQHRQGGYARPTFANSAQSQPKVMMTRRSSQTISPIVDNQAGFMPTIPQHKTEQPATKPVQHRVTPKVNVHPASKLSEADRQAIVKRAAQVREQARRQAEAKAKADALAKMQSMIDKQNASKRQANSLTSVMMRSADAGKQSNQGKHELASPAVNVFAPATVNPVSTKKSVSTLASSTNIQTTKAEPSHNNLNDANIQVDQAGAIAVSQPNFWQRLAGAKITFSFKFNKQRFFTVLRYLAVIVIIAASGYLAWDTYMTNRAVKENFSGDNVAAAMSIAGANPATADQTAVSQEDKAAYTVPADQPRMIYIPAIGVNARVMSVGVNSKGNIDTPANLNDTAWYDGSAKPGQDGQVFIDGHTSFSNSLYAAFNDLPKLHQGDLITIEKGNGEKINYRVSAVETVDADKVDMGKALNPPEGATKGLTLMTCTGTFNYRTQTADKRLVVYAVQE